MLLGTHCWRTCLWFCPVHPGPRQLGRYPLCITIGADASSRHAQGPRGSDDMSSLSLGPLANVGRCVREGQVSMNAMAARLGITWDHVRPYKVMPAQRLRQIWSPRANWNNDLVGRYGAAALVHDESTE